MPKHLDRLRSQWRPLAVFVLVGVVVTVAMQASTNFAWFCTPLGILAGTVATNLYGRARTRRPSG